MRLLPIFLVKTFSVLFLCSSPAAAQQTELDSLKEKILKMDVASTPYITTWSTLTSNSGQGQPSLFPAPSCRSWAFS